MVLLQPIKSMFALKPGCATGSFSYLLEVQEIQEDPENEQPFLNEIKTWDWTFSLMDKTNLFSFWSSDTGLLMKTSSRSLHVVLWTHQTFSDDW